MTRSDRGKLKDSRNRIAEYDFLSHQGHDPVKGLGVTHSTLPTLLNACPVNVIRRMWFLVAAVHKTSWRKLRRSFLGAFALAESISNIGATLKLEPTYSESVKLLPFKYPEASADVVEKYYEIDIFSNIHKDFQRIPIAYKGEQMELTKNDRNPVVIQDLTREGGTPSHEGTMTSLKDLEDFRWCVYANARLTPITLLKLKRAMVAVLGVEVGQQCLKRDERTSAWEALSRAKSRGFDWGSGLGHRALPTVSSTRNSRSSDSPDLLTLRVQPLAQRFVLRPLQPPRRARIANKKCHNAQLGTHRDPHACASCFGNNPYDKPVNGLDASVTASRNHACVLRLVRYYPSPDDLSRIFPSAVHRPINIWTKGSYCPFGRYSARRVPSSSAPHLVGYVRLFP
ncbi:hypothetical protein OBBRIDRAFT_803035 [Obba rivulosa]|uniref:Uncharacterized protein n=1 Tax=Obba rivulosa TaxID=1052685 RepID=A0A8E2DNW6_9APHY|nr:hypothetical protein OBBRIDRAFT_803035 [Obba rivulosa]